MLKINPILLLSIIILLAAAGLALCFKNSTMQLIAKVFKINAPAFSAEEYNGYKFRLSRPEDLTSGSNPEKKYPLVVYLHGAGERGSDNRKQSYDLTFLGNGFTKESKSFQQKHPSFVYVPQCPNDASWDGPTLTHVIETIDHLISTYPIDRNRLYLIGYSMGGSGTYALADRFYKTHNQLFAGIIRLAGQSSFDSHAHEVIAKSSVWLHVGLKDNPLRIEKAREAYDFLKSMSKNAVENVKPVDIDNHPGKTWSLLIGDEDRYKKTEYSNDGHGISHFPFQDPQLLEWLFHQRLK